MVVIWGLWSGDHLMHVCSSSLDFRCTLVVASVFVVLLCREGLAPVKCIYTPGSLGCCQCFGMHYFISFLVCNHLEEVERPGCFAFIVFGYLATVNVL